MPKYIPQKPLIQCNFCGYSLPHWSEEECIEHEKGCPHNPENQKARHALVGKCYLLVHQYSHSVGRVVKYNDNTHNFVIEEFYYNERKRDISFTTECSKTIWKDIYKEITFEEYKKFIQENTRRTIPKELME